MGKNKGAKAKQSQKKKAQKQARSDKPKVDLSFGMKNKKGRRAQQQMKAIAGSGYMSEHQRRELQRKKEEKLEAKKRKQQERERQRELKRIEDEKRKKALEKGCQGKKIDKVCKLFEKGRCPFGDKCRYSHDLSNVTTVEKINIYEDPRIKKGMKITTESVCKRFLRAVEKGTYGFRWICPNGGNKCPFLHAVPKQFVLKTEISLEDLKEDEANKMSLEELIDKMIVQLPPRKELTPVTAETFAVWKKAKQERLKKQAEEEEKKVAKSKKKTKRYLHGMDMKMSGKQLWEYRPELFDDPVEKQDAEKQPPVPVKEKEEPKKDQKEIMVDEDLFADLDI